MIPGIVRAAPKYTKMPQSRYALARGSGWLFTWQIFVTRRKVPPDRTPEQWAKIGKDGKKVRHLGQTPRIRGTLDNA